MSKHTPPGEATLLDLLRERAQTYGDKLAFGFSYDGDGCGGVELTYRELDLRARSIAAGLQEQGAAGERVLVLCRPGLDHIAGYFGCIYAGAVAVPVHERLAPRLSSVVPDARARFVLGVSETHEGIRTALEALGQGRDLQWALMDGAPTAADRWVMPDIDGTTTAMVQYTSGSTTAPKGVVLTHGNLLRNLEAIRESWPGGDTDVACFWLPSHHDMGLIGGVLSMIHLGTTTHLMSPTAFVKRPMAWMEALSRHRATYTVAPNFAFDLCVEHSTAQERAALDLSSLRTVMNGAEPVQAASLQSFATAFAPAGFRAEAFSAVYGLAEATLMVSGGSDSDLPLVAHIDREALNLDRIADGVPGDRSVAVVGCGQPRGGQVAIVNPVTRRRCEANEVGEIWFAGPSVGQGYWGRPDESEHAFAASIEETSEGPFLRTGDIGFLARGELFITGRIKDLIVIRGGNHYPNDVELTVQRCHPALLSGRGAAFAFTPGLRQVEELVIVQEVARDRIDETECAATIDDIRAAVAERYGLHAHSVLLVDRSTIPTTSSGKIQRGQCRQHFLDGKLQPIAKWQKPAATEDLIRAGQFEKAVAAAELVRVALTQRSRADAPS